MRTKRQAMVTVSISHVRHLWSQSAHILGWSVQKNFVKTVRAVELLFGIQVEGYPALQGIPNNADMTARLKKASTVDNSGLFDPESVVGKALTEAAFILPDIILQLNWLVDFGACQGCTSLTTRLFFSLLHLSSESYDGAISSFMDILWQHNNPENPANAAIGPQAYDHHIYYKLVLTLFYASFDLAKVVLLLSQI
jgi:glucan endo-1,6-beta-glucosidase